jgi:hypothetical protein
MRVTATLFFAALVTSTAALGQSDGGVEYRERCARRLASAIMGTGPTAAMMSATNPQTEVPNLLATVAQPTDGGMNVTPFQERFSRFINGTFNPDMGMQPAEDATYYMTRYVLMNNLPWRNVFVGQNRVDPGPTVFDEARVVTDVNGLGYFRSRIWMVRYAGNEVAGYRLVAAYRMINNVLGVKLTAAQNTDGVDSATRQSNPACSGCHYDPVFGLDLVAKVLSKRSGTGTTMTFIAPNEGAQTLLGGQSISNDSQLINAMVNSNDFKFRSCRLAMEFLYGRDEFKCEGQVFDACMTAFSSTGKITDAISAIARDPSFCQ